MPLIKDEQLHSFGLTALADILLLRAFCNDTHENTVFEGNSRKHRSSLLKRLVLESESKDSVPCKSDFNTSGRMKKKKKSAGTTCTMQSLAESSSVSRKPGRPPGLFRSVSFGLRLAKTHRGRPYKQISCPLGDRNTITIDVKYETTYDELLKEAVDFIFPEGRNKHLGKASDYCISLVNNDNDLIKADFGDGCLRQYMKKKGIRGLVRLQLLCDDEHLPDLNPVTHVRHHPTINRPGDTCQTDTGNVFVTMPSHTSTPLADRQQLHRTENIRENEETSQRSAILQSHVNPLVDYWHSFDVSMDDITAPCTPTDKQNPFNLELDLPGTGTCMQNSQDVHEVNPDGSHLQIIHGQHLQNVIATDPNYMCDDAEVPGASRPAAIAISDDRATDGPEPTGEENTVQQVQPMANSTEEILKFL